MIAEKRGGCKTAIWKRVHGIDETRGHRVSLRNALPERKKVEKNCITGLTRAGSGKSYSMLFLAQKIHGNPSFIFTLIQKFNKPNQEPIYPDHDIIIRRILGPGPGNIPGVLRLPSQKKD